jgi:Protein of unknown function (DUF3800)
VILAVDEHLSCGDEMPCIQVRRLTAGLSAAVRLGRYFVTIEIFQTSVDESGYGQTGDDEAFVFAGYGGRVTQVEDLMHKWDEILNEHPRWSIRELKERVRQDEPDERIKRLIKAIDESGVGALTFLITPDAYQKWITVFHARLRSRPPKVFAGGPYFFAFMTLLLRTMVGVSADGKVELIYDENLAERRKMECGYRRFLRELKEDHPDLLPRIAKDPVPRNDEEWLPLAAADMLAWHTHREHVERSNGRPYVSEAWTALKNIRSHVEEIWTVKKVLEILND